MCCTATVYTPIRSASTKSERCRRPPVARIDLSMAYCTIKLYTWNLYMEFELVACDVRRFQRRMEPPTLRRIGRRARSSGLSTRPALTMNARKTGGPPKRLTSLGERLTIPSCGLQCLLADIYDETPLIADGIRTAEVRAHGMVKPPVRPLACPMINSEKPLNGPSIWRVP